MTDKEFNLGKKLFLSGTSLRQIQEDCGINRKQLSYKLRQAGINTKVEPTKEITKKKYDDQMYLDIVEDYISNNISMLELENKYGVSDSTINRILKYHRVDTNNTSAIYQYRENIFEQIDTEEKAYWLGFLFADGNVKSDTSYILELTLAEIDEDHLQKFSEFIGTNPAPLKKRYVSLGEKTFVSYRLSICNKKIVCDLIKLGCVPNKSLVLKFPKIPEHLRNHFMRGYFDGDGTLHLRKDGQYVFSVIGTIDFLDVYEDILHSIGVNKTKYHTQGNAYSARHSGNIQVGTIVNYLYKNSTVCLERKKKLLSNAVLS
jgi:intein-encoded DNA endonuclease-like protein